ncbi:MAG: protein-glutamate O-methyltransferase CheR [Gammaproteobacteria bacterium]|nr:protein-glutamate O-methyltransferase CheR [Gammaproteobacteria bacterium]
MVTVASSLLSRSQTVHEFNIPTMDNEQFDRWVKLVGSRIGIRTSALRKTFLTNALDKRLLETHTQDYNTYYECLQADDTKGELEWTKLIDLLTVKETRFFRHPSSLHLLGEYVRDKLTMLNDNAKKQNKKNSLTAWSIGCATGEEAYTIAIILDQLINQFEIESCYFSVFASDISQESLLFARKGIYSAAQLKGMDKSLIREYFSEYDNNKYQIVDNLKRRICFTKKNVLDFQHNNIGQMDIIFCQNLLIYFEHSTRITILNNLVVPHLAPNGLLILGPGEIYHWANAEMSLINNENNLAYRKSGATAPPIPSSPSIIPGTTP